MREFINFFKFFYKLKGRKVLYLLAVMIGAAFFETIGVSMFLPLLEEGTMDSRLGRIIQDGFLFIGISYSMANILLIMVFFIS